MEKKGSGNSRNFKEKTLRQYKAIIRCMLNCFSLVKFFETPWTVASQALLSMVFSRQEYQLVAISYSRGSSQPRDQTWVSCISCIGRQVLYQSCHLGNKGYLRNSSVTEVKEHICFKLKMINILYRTCQTFRGINL